MRIKNSGKRRISHRPQTRYLQNIHEKDIPKAIRAAGNSAICREFYLRTKLMAELLALRNGFY